MKHSKRALVFLTLIALAVGLGAFNYYLWKLQAGKKQIIIGLQSQVELHEKENRLLTERNAGKAKEITTLQSPDSYYIYEEKAREEYGMIGKNETYFVLTAKELNRIPDIPGLTDAAAEEDSIAMPNSSEADVVQLESAGEPPITAPSPAASEEPAQNDAPPLQLESIAEPPAAAPPPAAPHEAAPDAPPPLQLESLQ